MSVRLVVSTQSLARDISNKFKIPICISGASDYIIDGSTEYKCPFGAELMTKVTGMGCVMTAVMSAFFVYFVNSWLGKSIPSSTMSTYVRISVVVGYVLIAF